MTDNIVIQKVKNAISGIEIGYFDTAKHYIFDEYFKYFNDDDKETRKYALLIFTSMLGNWYSKSTFVFKPKKERLKYDDGIETDYYNFESYLSSLLDSHQYIEKEFPYMFEYIVVYLILIEKDKGSSYEEWFPEINPDIFKQLREKILIPNSNLAQGGHPIKYLFREVGIEPFFLTDFFEE
ncbi:hypothetical protein [Lysinibacillus sphaericus]|uniref:hypothetical protein n=1 Tax=Lysinibacillus sphaericus TaxID=1421 RepID=UPI000C18A50D|nr:hypothetical protein [Lysinibacillus sphaericus]PIJ96848.1 hypothetical protein CTN02_15655 [Lysinibacillus sphaericus]